MSIERRAVEEAHKGHTTAVQSPGKTPQRSGPGCSAACRYSCVLLLLLASTDAWAQSDEADSRAEQALRSEPGQTAGQGDATQSEDTALNVLELLRLGGPLMLPIALMSVLVLAFGIERAIALRRQKILPEELVIQLGAMNAQGDGFDPRRSYRLCQQYPSSAATVIRAMLLKLGRPHHEVERTISEVTHREAGRLYGNVRTLSLAAAITPLLGLLGTVWGMIQAFFATANMPVGANKAESLAEGIYVALVTTFAGLAVAIPAAVLAHLFEGRIESRMRQVEELVDSMLPNVEALEGSLRLGRQVLEAKEQAEDAAAPAPPPKTPATAAASSK